MERLDTLGREASRRNEEGSGEPSLHPYLLSPAPPLAPGLGADLGAGEALLRRVLKWLPEPSGRILLVGSRTDPFRERLSAAGYEVTASDRLPEERPPGPPYSAILLLEALAPATALATVLETLRSSLTDSGWLVLLEVLDLPSRDPLEGLYLSTAKLEVALAEGGFCLRREQDWPSEAAVAVERALAPKRGAGEGPDDPSSARPQAWRGRLERLRDGRAVYRALAARREQHRLRTYRDGDEEQILDLFAETFLHRRNLDHWNWQYRSNPWGALKLSLAFDEGGQLVAQYAAYPMHFLRMEAGELKTVLAHQVGDTMTRPSVRDVGRGPSSLLGRTARYFFARFCEGQVSFNYGFNVGNIQRFSMLILKARKVAPVTYWQRPLPAPELRPLPLWKRWRGCRIETVESVDGRWDQFLRQVAPDYRFLICRDQAYLRWRYLERPGYDYHLFAAFERGRLMGWSVFRRQDDRLVWGDGLLSHHAPELAAHLLAAALASPFAAGVSQIDGWFAPQPEWFRRLLGRLGFQVAPEPQDLALMISPFEREPAADALRTELYYTLGDSDLF